MPIKGFFLTGTPRPPPILHFIPISPGRAGRETYTSIFSLLAQRDRSKSVVTTAAPRPSASAYGESASCLAASAAPGNAAPNNPIIRTTRDLCHLLPAIALSPLIEVAPRRTENARPPGGSARRAPQNSRYVIYPSRGTLTALQERRWPRRARHPRPRLR